METISQFIEKVKTENVLKLAALTALAYYASISIVSNNPYFWLVLVALPVVLMLLTDVRFGFYFIVFSVFFVDWFVQLEFIPTQLSWGPEIILLVLTIKVVMLKIKGDKFTRTPIDIPVLLFIITGVASAIFNSQSFIAALLAFRLDLKFILMFNCDWCLLLSVDYTNTDGFD
jgi:hypothetical protein